ncbi:hypothetical protein R6Q59_026217 [Mikania micrantha]
MTGYIILSRPTTDGLICILDSFEDAKVTLDEVDLFWRKLDLNPSLVNEDEGADIDEQLDRVIQHIKLQPNPVKKSTIFPGFLNHKTGFRNQLLGYRNQHLTSRYI